MTAAIPNSLPRSTQAVFALFAELVADPERMAATLDALDQATARDHAATKAILKTLPPELFAPKRRAKPKPKTKTKPKTKPEPKTKPTKANRAAATRPRTARPPTRATSTPKPTDSTRTRAVAPPNRHAASPKLAAPPASRGAGQRAKRTPPPTAAPAAPTAAHASNIRSVRPHPAQAVATNPPPTPRLKLTTAPVIARPRPAPGTARPRLAPSRAQRPRESRERRAHNKKRAVSYTSQPTARALYSVVDPDRAKFNPPPVPPPPTLTRPPLTLARAAPYDDPIRAIASYRRRLRPAASAASPTVSAAPPGAGINVAKNERGASPSREPSVSNSFSRAAHPDPNSTPCVRENFNTPGAVTSTETPEANATSDALIGVISIDVISCRTSRVEGPSCVASTTSTPNHGHAKSPASKPCASRLRGSSQPESIESAIPARPSAMPARPSVSLASSSPLRSNRASTIRPNAAVQPPSRSHPRPGVRSVAGCASVAAARVWGVSDEGAASAGRTAPIVTGAATPIATQAAARTTDIKAP